MGMRRLERELLVMGMRGIWSDDLRKGGWGHSPLTLIDHRFPWDAQYCGFVSCTSLRSLFVPGSQINNWRKRLIDRIIELVGCKIHLRVEALIIELICTFIRSTLL